MASSSGARQARLGLCLRARSALESEMLAGCLGGAFVEKDYALRALIDVMRDHGAAGGALVAAIARAEKRAGLTRTKEIDEAQLDLLLSELAAEGGRIQQAAERIASWRAESGSGTES